MGSPSETQIIDDISGFLSQLNDSQTEFDFIQERKALTENDLNTTATFKKLFMSGSSYKLNSSGVTVELKSPFFISNIRVFSTNLNINISIENTISDGLKKVYGTEENNSQVYSVNKIASKILFAKKEGFLLKKTEISKIEIYGWAIEDFIKIEHSLSRAQTIDQQLKNEWKNITQKTDALRAAIKEELAIKENAIASLEAEEIELSERILSINGNIEALTKENKNLDDKNQELQSEYKKLSENNATEIKKREEVSLQIAKMQAELTELTKEEAKKKTTLRELTSNINLFPDDLKGFTDRSGTAKRTYMWIALVPIFIFVIFCWRFIGSSESLLAASTGLMTIDSVVASLIQRLPYVIIMSTIIGGAFGFLFHTLKRIEEIHQQELNLSKISIIAKDIYDSTYGEELTEDNTQQDKKLDIKLRMIKEYLYAEFVRSDKEMLKTSEKYDLLSVMTQHGANLIDRFQRVPSLPKPNKQQETD